MTVHLLLTVILLLAVNLPLMRRRRRRAHGVKDARHIRRRAHSLRYEFYLHSALWRGRRRLWIAQTHGRCEDCGRRRRPLTIHHTTYQRLGHERRGDVQVLCWECHQARHVRSPA
jgi:hypothetical protein